MTISNEKEAKQSGAGGNAEAPHNKNKHETAEEQLQSSHPTKEKEKTRESDEMHGKAGKHRLFEGRQQHDDHDKSSEKTRLSRDIDEHGHDREQFQVPGGKERHPALPDDS